MNMLIGWLTGLIANCITLAARFITGARAIWLGCHASHNRRLYFANHSSHGDFVLLWASLPALLRKRTRPVAGAEYWQNTALKRFISQRVFNAVLVPRGSQGAGNPLAPVQQALADGDSLIFFPEGTRNLSESPLLPFKSGIYHLAHACPDLELIPVWITNLNRAMPKGRYLPLPLLCTLRFGAPIKLQDEETKVAFLERLRLALLAMSREDV
ncbi:lysophospholipid acyltransferase family protein [Halomonas llamarensis]|uniref:1-acyl-sn-glycerol-3-phosphate acyltransferase n=1 Tax=Halomonas llamarensis TaxID=2945104 RepID=A0ABT0SWB4_9GAMM|nr:lysophospholipid acyltransferase family protein [Halomonas llamarensis]MCL7931594.1 1-acyl-sn-glycerol-3-phosphate acyltransferase [Halomonas llamarensis]